MFPNGSNVKYYIKLPKQQYNKHCVLHTRTIKCSYFVQCTKCICKNVCSLYHMVTNFSNKGNDFDNTFFAFIF